MWGVVAWEQTPGGRDINNPDVSRQNRPTLGMPILLDMKKKAGLDQWEGQVYNAKDGQTYSSTITPMGNDQLEIKGCVLGFLCGGETWTRVAPPDPEQSRQQHGQKRDSPEERRRPWRRRPPGQASPSKLAQQAAAQAGQTPDPVGDICLLPDIARLPH